MFTSRENTYIRGIADKKDHAGRVGSSEFGDDPCHRLELCDFCVIDQECSSRKDDRIVTKENRKKGEHDVEIEVEPPSAAATLVTDPKRSGPKYTSNVECYSHVSQREKQDEDIVRLDTFRAHDAVANDLRVETLCGPQYCNSEDWCGGQV